MELLRLANYCNNIYNTEKLENSIIDYDNHGFKSAVIKDDIDKTLIIVIRGTNNIQGIVNDIEMILHINPFFTEYAKTIFEMTLEYNNQFKLNYNIIVTGHSLGGSLGQYLSNKYGIQSYNFNPYGIMQSLETISQNNVKLAKNYIVWNDVVSSINTSHEYGINYVFKTNDNNCLNLSYEYLHIHDITNIIKLLENGVVPCKL
jgi:hypothetical protein